MQKTFSLLLSLILTLTFVSCDLSGNNQIDTSSDVVSSIDTSNVEIKDPDPTIDRNYTKPEGATGVLVQYPTYPEELNRNYDYEVYVSNGVETIQLPVYNPSRHKNSFSPIKDTDSNRRFCEFGFEGEVTVSVKVKLQMSNYVILPTSKGIKSTYKDSVITFKLDKPENIAIRLNSDTNTVLTIFAEELETDYPKETDERVIYFKAGLNNISEHSDVKFQLTSFGEFVVPIGYSVYLEPGALVTAKIESEAGNSNFKIYGRGAFIDARLDRISDGELANMVFMDTNSNFTIKDVKFLDAHSFNLCFTRARNAVIKNVKLLSSEISTDGITFWGHESYMPGYNDNILIEGCYLFVSDNMFVITSANGMTVKDCTIASRYAVLYPQGQLNDFTMENCDILEMGAFVKGQINMAQDGQTDATWNIKLKDIRAEDALSMQSFFWAHDQGNGKKMITMENVSLPSPKSTGFDVGSTTNVIIKCKNVFIDGTPFLNKNLLSSNTTEVIVDIDKYSSAEDAKTGIFQKSIVKAETKGEPRINLGGYIVPFDKKGALEVEGYLPADNLMKEIAYSGDITPYVKEIDGVRMLPYSFFKDVLKMTVKTDKTGVYLSAYNTSGNLLKDGGFENMEQPLFETDFANSEEWTCFNFGGLYLEKEFVRSGEGAMRLAIKKKGGDRGLAQFISPVIQQYGKGTYTFEFYARLRGETDVMTDVYYGLTEANWSFKGNIATSQLTTEWQKFTYTFKVTDPNMYEYNHAFIVIGSKADKKPIEIFVDDAALYFHK